MNKPEFVYELPPSDKPWRITAHNGSVIIAHPDHPPVRLKAGYGHVLRVEQIDDGGQCVS